MKKYISLFLVASILLVSGNLFAKHRRGADLIIQKTDGTQVRGELIAVKQTSLVLLERDSGADAAIDLDEIRIIKIKKKSYAGTGFLLGGLLGAGLGASIYRDPESYFEGSLRILMGGHAGFALGGALLFGFIGAAIGTAVGTDRTFQMEGKSDSEIQEILEKLSKKARLKNAQ